MRAENSIIAMKENELQTSTEFGLFRNSSIINAWYYGEYYTISRSHTVS